jgi:hypothetical protein
MQPLCRIGGISWDREIIEPYRLAGVAKGLKLEGFINSPVLELEEMEREEVRPGPGRSRRQKTDCHRGNNRTCNNDRGNNRPRNNGHHEN